ncbi:uncharacterized protein BJ212DRAFT_354339 [Suillus subaureus]|uniref:Uncharacterized protein n=1 Tax=Suillus subaureus TaxID=48587 RepID=A0A9P7DL93_9AGAM|nr:uncharacterized protein BJ212DRAFT_354339 [Suillus subaureus]KAG1797642.1 hypothetical protein BJ212DRAFT_354339 [Suillus subaureus]
MNRVPRTRPTVLLVLPSLCSNCLRYNWLVRSWEVCDIFSEIHRINKHHVSRECTFPRYYECPACSSFICAFQAHIVIQQRDMHSTAQQLISDHTGSTTSPEVYVQARPP